MKLQGSIVALITPFHADGTVNFERLGEILDWHVAQGTDGILVLGTTGESSTMSHEEDDEVCRFAIDRVAGRVPVIAGSGSNSTETQLEKSKKYAQMGADALLCITPYYIKANAEGMYRHFADVADAVDVPVILYNVPGRTGCAIPEETVARLARHPQYMRDKRSQRRHLLCGKDCPVPLRRFPDVLWQRRHYFAAFVPGSQRGYLGLGQYYAGSLPSDGHGLSERPARAGAKSAVKISGSHQRAVHGG